MKGSTAASLASNLGLQSLLREPERLNNEAERLNIELESLVLEHYKVFVENLTCSLHLQNEEKHLEETWQSLYHHIIDLSTNCSVFREHVQAFVLFHKRNRKTLQHHLELLELLELPQLVDACIRTGLLDEALDLALFVNNLERKHLLAQEVTSTTTTSTTTTSTTTTSDSSSGTSTTSVSSHNNGKSFRHGADVIQRIVNDVHTLLTTLQQSLLLQMTESTTLPRLITILSALRKMDSLFIDRYLSRQRFLGTTTTTTTSGSSGQGSGQGSATSGSGSGSNDVMQWDKMRESFLQAAEQKHQLDFLEARTVFLLRQQQQQQHVAAAGGGGGGTTTTTSSSSSSSLGAYGKAMELIESRRAGLYSVIGQYQTLFLDHQHHHTTTSTSTSTSTTSSVRGSGQGSGSGSSQYEAASIALHSWIVQQVHQWIIELTTLLEELHDGSSLKSIYDQAFHLSQRLAQLGSDMTPLLLDTFSHILSEKIKKVWLSAMSHWDQLLTTERIRLTSTNTNSSTTSNTTSNTTTSGVEQMLPLFSLSDSSAAGTPPLPPPPSSGLPTTSSMMMTTSSVGGAGGGGSGSGQEITPPYHLQSYPVLAYACNAILQGLTLCQQVPLLSIASTTLTTLLDTLHQLILSLVKYRQQVCKLGEKYHQKVLDIDYGKVIAMDLIPHVIACFAMIYHPQEMMSIRYIQWQRSHHSHHSHLVQDIDDVNILFGGGGGGGGGGGVERLRDDIVMLWKVLVDCGLLPETVLQSKQKAFLARPLPLTNAATTTTTTSASVSGTSATGSGSDGGSAPPSSTAVVAVEESADTNTSGSSGSIAVVDEPSPVAVVNDGVDATATISTAAAVASSSEVVEKESTHEEH